MSEPEPVTPEMDDEELVGAEVTTARAVDSDLDVMDKGFMKIKYIDDEVVFYKNVNYDRESHGQENRETWDERVHEGYYKLVGEEYVDEVEDANQNGRLEELEEVKGVGASSLEELEKNGYTSLADVTEADPSDLIEVPKIGRKTIERIRDRFGGLEGEITYPSQSRSTSKSKSNEQKNNNDDEQEEEESTTDESDDDEDDGWSQLVEADDDDWSMQEL